MRIRTVNIDADIEAILQEAILDGNKMILNSQLSPALYKRVMKVIELIGFKWDRKLKCHIGEGDAADKLRQALSDGKVVNEKKTYQFYETPDAVADHLVELADIGSHHSVLEPNAGKGAIVRAIQRGCPNLAVVYACELNLVMASDLSNLSVASSIAGYGDVDVSCGDFLEYNRKVDRIVMNPPFCQLQDIDHLRHAYDLLNSGGIVVAILSKAWQTNGNRKAQSFRDWSSKQDMYVEDLPAGTFSKSGTEIGAMIVKIAKT